MIVRSVLVTSLNLDVGRHMWWPSALAGRRDEPETAPAEGTRVPAPRGESEAAEDVRRGQ